METGHELAIRVSTEKQDARRGEDFQVPVSDTGGLL